MSAWLGLPDLYLAFTCGAVLGGIVGMTGGMAVGCWYGRRQVRIERDWSGWSQTKGDE